VRCADDGSPALSRESPEQRSDRERIRLARSPGIAEIVRLLADAADAARGSYAATA
jgi:hypothetical protein